MRGRRLKHLLERTCELLLDSAPSVWSPLAPLEVEKNLREQIRRIEVGEPVDTSLIAVEFAVTSAIQEIAMWNRWHAEYLVIAEQVDVEVERLGDGC